MRISRLSSAKPVVRGDCRAEAAKQDGQLAQLTRQKAAAIQEAEQNAQKITDLEEQLRQQSAELAEQLSAVCT